MNDQSIKQDKEKLDLTLVPTQIIKDIAAVREFGIKKYGDSENWKKVNIKRYLSASFRHFIEVLDNPCNIDVESGLPSLWHLECNLAFISQLIENDVKEKVNETHNISFNIALRFMRKGFIARHKKMEYGYYYKLIDGDFCLCCMWDIVETNPTHIINYNDNINKNGWFCYETVEKYIEEYYF